MPITCPFQCGDAATTWSPGSAPRDITVYTCAQCGIFGITGKVEGRLHGTETADRQLEKQFLLMREDLARRRPVEAPAGSTLVGVFDMGENGSGLELAFINPKDPTTS
jgi:hypothetical protein